MFAPKHILVPVDADVTGDKLLAEELVDAAADLANKLDARLTLIHVALPAASPAVPPVDTFGEAYRAMLDVVEARNAAAARTLEALKEHAQRGGRNCETHLVTRAGNVPELIIDTAKELGADLIVVATHGRRGIRRVVLGSVAERTAHLSPVPVLLLPPRHT